ncbi:MULTISPECIES: hypothetical protein [Aerosakkonema]|uniref:hypothetical protein n=1 Tax=Aerosakkonema TaxID=1246629 RepID=UPI0035B81BAD
MKPEVIDVTGLNAQQITIVQEIVGAFRAVSRQQVVNQTVINSGQEEDQLKQLHREFDWWVADVGVKETLNQNIYCSQV